MKVNDSQRSYPQKRRLDSDGEGNNERKDANHDGNDDSKLNPSDDEFDVPLAGSDGSQFKMSEEGKAFLEATYKSHLEYATRKVQAAKYGQPMWMTCLILSPVLEATLPKDTVKEDKGTYKR